MSTALRKKSRILKKEARGKSLIGFQRARSDAEKIIKFSLQASRSLCTLRPPDFIIGSQNFWLDLINNIHCIYDSSFLTS